MGGRQVIQSFRTSLACSLIHSVYIAIVCTYIEFSVSWAQYWLSIGVALPKNAFGIPFARCCLSVYRNPKLKELGPQSSVTVRRARTSFISGTSTRRWRLLAGESDTNSTLILPCIITFNKWNGFQLNLISFSSEIPLDNQSFRSKSNSIHSNLSNKYLATHSKLNRRRQK